MSYDNPFRTYHTLSGNISGALSKNIRGPKGKRGRIARVFGSVTTTTSWTTLAPIITVTTTVAPVPNRKGGVVYPASTTIFSATLVPTTAPAGFDSENLQGLAGGPGNILTDENNFRFMTAADTDLVFAVSAATGTPAGAVEVILEILWI